MGSFNIVPDHDKQILKISVQGTFTIADALNLNRAIKDTCEKHSIQQILCTRQHDRTRRSFAFDQFYVMRSIALNPQTRLAYVVADPEELKNYELLSNLVNQQNLYQAKAFIDSPPAESWLMA